MWEQAYGQITAQWKKKLRRQRARYKARLDNAEADADAELEALKNALSEARVERDGARAARAKLQDEASVLESRIKRLQRRCADFQGAVDELRATSLIEVARREDEAHEPPPPPAARRAPRAGQPEYPTGGTWGQPPPKPPPCVVCGQTCAIM